MEEDLYKFEFESKTESEYESAELEFFRKATKEEMPEIMSIVNSAYSVEEGNTGISFKNTTRFKNLQEVEDCLKNMYVLEDKLIGQIVGVVCVELLKQNKVASIGPVAVHPDQQVKFVYSKKAKIFEKSIPISFEISAFILKTVFCTTSSYS